MTRSNEPVHPFIHSVRAGQRGISPILLLHAASLDLTYWDGQFGELAKTHDVVAFDWPGHGRSGSLRAETSFEDLAAVAAAVLHEAGGPAHVVGVSMGSMVAQYLALAHPGLVRSLCLIGTACTLADPVRRAMRDRAATARRDGMQAVLETATGHWFTPEFRRRRPDVIDRVEKTFLAFDPVQYATLWEMVATLETTDRLAELACPTLVLVGEQDASTPPAAAHAVASRIRGARVEVITGAAHLLPTEDFQAVNGHLQTFLSEVESI